ncbi:hypothetical protein H072_10017 [Dactylellina haptotyla CBS 200.50]|uniref:VOC domain-containing protein n=1 Tax=Dactylellina haptotyla (strain CBS 200.50) TaxID=1284197 RepID=S8BMQ6_DACHA|nr:hypothetical protein H072_10017 [Dactylellina haptotyla CBS 200.50]
MSDKFECTESKPTPTGFSWVEIPVKDMKRALKFYSDAFGWTPTNTKDSTSPYHIIQNPFGNLNGALHQVSDENHVAGTATRPSILPYIGLNSIEEPLAKVKEAGGEIIVPGEEIPGGMGFFAHFYDSERNVVGIWAMKMSLST